MITRGIVDSKVDSYRVKIRIPLVDGIPADPNSTRTSSLRTAVLATIPGLEVDLQEGDVVIVEFDGTDESACILGYLYRDASMKKSVSMFLEKLEVHGKSILSEDTSIGNVTSRELMHLSGLRDNIQVQLDELSRKLENLRGV